MRRSFGMRSGGMGGGGGVQEALRTITTTRPIINKPTNTFSNILSLSTSSSNTSPCSPTAATISATSSTRYSSSCSYLYDSDDHEWEWEFLDGREDEIANGFYYDSHIFGQIPSKDEVEHAVSALQQVPSAGSDLDWIEPALHVYNPRTLRSHGYKRVYDAFHLLQTEPTVQRMVVSLSTDKAVWDAVLNNEVVQELRESFYTDFMAYAAENEDEPWSSGEDLDSTQSILKWILEKTKEKVIELIEKITFLLNVVFQPQEKKTQAAEDMFGDTLRSSLLLSVLVLLIVVMTRAQRS
ncbi:hypothetical protein BVC80_927g7 [Macleaya cordata]|uniref:Uncharacterized protein n=1 Tax=Macleaya cordata TaxID=56857 RepID=A0A200PVA3_MACCD|nr:hypothetical protein BVC80_927g7 [Macleaya cordata]